MSREQAGESTVKASGGPGPPAPAVQAHLGDRVGDFIGPYKLLQVLGEGGFGVVWLGERREPMVQRVALKVIKPGMDSKLVLARFEQERQALAVMDHPNVAKVFDSGATGRGLPYFVMEHVHGEPITDYCDRHRLTIRERLDLFIPVCEAVQHAHHKGIIHRDIKPSNILVTVGDKHAVPKVIDFGVAKAISHAFTTRTIFTESGQMIGTPEYMSPEQAEMGATDIDTRSDVYSLGVVLYELLTGALPFGGQELRSKGYHEIQRIIRDVDPPRPSTRLTSLGESAVQIARQRQLQRESLARALRRELEWVPLKAMRKDRAHRYKTAVELADDIRNYLDGKALIAGPESTFYRVRKFAQRHRHGVLLAIVANALVIAAVAGTGWGFIRAARERDRAELARQQAEAVCAFLTDTLAAGDPHEAHGNKEATVREAIERAESKLQRGDLASAPSVVVRLRTTIGRAYHGLGLYEQAERVFRSAIALGEQRLDRLDRELLIAKREITWTLQEMGKLKEAESLAREAADGLAQTLGADDPETLMAESRFGIALGVQGRIEESLASLARTADAQARVAGPDHAETLRTLNARACTEMALGRWPEALRDYERVAAAQKRAVGPEAFDTLVSTGNLGEAYRVMGRAREAVDTLGPALAAARRTLGDDNPFTRSLGESTAYSLMVLDRTADTRELLGVLSLQKTPLEGQHVALGRIYAALGTLDLQENKPAQAEASFRRGLALYPPNAQDAPDRGFLLAGLGASRFRQGDSAGAEPLLRQGIDLAALNGFRFNPQRSAHDGDLGECLASLGKPEEAENQLLKSYNDLAAMSSPDFVMTRQAADRLARFYQAQQRATEATQWRAKGTGL